MAKKVKRLYRSKDNRIISGICGGIGEYMEVDPTVVRAVTILVAVITGFFPVLLAYLIMHFIVPEK